MKKNMRRMQARATFGSFEEPFELRWYPKVMVLALLGTSLWVLQAEAWTSSCVVRREDLEADGKGPKWRTLPFQLKPCWLRLCTFPPFNSETCTSINSDRGALQVHSNLRNSNEMVTILRQCSRDPAEKGLAEGCDSCRGESMGQRDCSSQN